MPRAAALAVRSPERWEALLAPARSEIVEAVRLLGPCSVADVAETIDRPADTLYKHIEHLRKAGFLIDAGFRRSGRHTEQLIDVVAEDFLLELAERRTARADEHRAVVRTTDAFLKAAGKAVRDSATARELLYGGSSRNISINYELSWLTPERFQEVRALIRRLKAVMDEGKRSREGRLYLTLAIATPVTRKRHARSRSGAERAPNTRRKAKPATVTSTSRAASRAPR